MLEKDEEEDMDGSMDKEPFLNCDTTEFHNSHQCQFYGFMTPFLRHVVHLPDHTNVFMKEKGLFPKGWPIPFPPFVVKSLPPATPQSSPPHKA